jgi:hypothetical protein
MALVTILLMALVIILLMALVTILLMATGGYSTNGYWWLFY